MIDDAEITSAVMTVIWRGGLVTQERGPRNALEAAADSLRRLRDDVISVTVKDTTLTIVAPEVTP